MKQVIVRGGRIEVAEVPAPAPIPGRALVATAYSVISSGTEGAVLAASDRSALERAVSHPAPLKRIVEVVREEGIHGVLHRLSGASHAEGFTELGYAASGVVAAKGEGIGIPVGTRVACAGSQFAHHAEMIAVPANLMAPVPVGLPMEEAAFATLGAIALHGFRRSEAKLGETVAVVGLGLVGLIGAQVARAAGCRVLAFDPAPDRVALARSLGLDGARLLGDSDPEAETAATTGGHGADAVLIFAASKTNDPLTLAMRIARRKGRVVIIGEIGMEADRTLLYAKELDLLISTSYGPGRYDPSYEEEGNDYPLPYVRWTEGRNLAAVLEMMADGRIRTRPLIERILPIAEAERAYAGLREPGRRPAFLLEYPGVIEGNAPSRSVVLKPIVLPKGEIGVGVVGPGSFLRGVFLPALARAGGARVLAVAAGTGASARSAAERFGASVATTECEAVLQTPGVGLVVIGTRHNLHAAQTLRALEAGKAVFVEKPLCLTQEELEQIREAHRASGALLAVGFNRRYAPLVLRMKEILRELPGSRVITVRVNAGRLPREHWTQDPRIGGGRLVGEGCHFLDLIPFLAGSEIVAVEAAPVPVDGETISSPDNFSIQIRHADGSLGTLIYTSLGDPSLPKERVEVHASGASMILDDFRTLSIHRAGRIRTHSSRGRDKGIDGEVRALLLALRGEPSDLISWEEIESAMHWTFRARELLEGSE